jgi:hypothetical protein
VLIVKKHLPTSVAPDAQDTWHRYISAAMRMRCGKEMEISAISAATHMAQRALICAGPDSKPALEISFERDLQTFKYGNSPEPSIEVRFGSKPDMCSSARGFKQQSA